MRIGVSALYQAGGGSLTYLSGLFRAWADDGTLERHDVVLFASGATAERLERQVGADVLRRVRVRVFAKADRGLLSRFIAEQFDLRAEIRKERIDVLFCPANVIPYGVPVPTVAVLQNAAPFCDSVTFRSVGWKWWLKFRLLGLFVRRTARHATRVIFQSRFFFDLFVQRYAFPPRRGVVILHAAGTPPDRPADRELEQSLGIRGPYVLSVSHINPYKNMVELIDGFAAAVRACGDGERQLVIAGQVNFPWYLSRMKEAIHRAGLDDRVLLTGPLPRRDVESLLAGCESFVFTSTCENCPNSLIEAMSFGLAIGSSNVGVMPEIGGDAVRYFDPYSPASIRDVLVALMTDPTLRRDLGERARTRAATFPDRAEEARSALAVIEAAAGKR